MAVFAFGRSELAQTLRGVWPFISLFLAGVLAIPSVIACFLLRLKRDTAIVLVPGIVFLVLGVPLPTWLPFEPTAEASYVCATLP